jgi:iron complex outermembrane recepter protein
MGCRVRASLEVLHCKLKWWDDMTKIEVKRSGTPAYARRALGVVLAIATLATCGSAIAANADVSTADTAAGASSEAAGDSSQTVESIIVTGTREEVESTKSLAPVQVISGVQLENTGTANLREALEAVIPSYAQGGMTGGSTAKAVWSSSLRGLGGNEVLILVNGKRRHNTAFINASTGSSLGQAPTDISLIPISAVDHVEVLLDGAAAQYGSDAIAGVINIILKSNDSGGSANASYGQNRRSVAQLGGMGEDGATPEADVFQGFKLGPNGGFFNVSANYLKQGSTNVLGAFPTNGTFPTNTEIYLPVDGHPDPREATADRWKQIWGDPEVDTISVGYNAELPLNDHVTLYSFSTYATRSSIGWGSYRAESSSTSIPSVDPGGYQPYLAIAEHDLQGVAGARATGLAGWDWDLSGSYAKDFGNLAVHDTINASLGPDQTLRTIENGGQSYSEWIIDLDAKRAVQTGLLESPLRIAAGLEYRKDTFAITAGEPDSYIDGGYVYPSDYPYAANRNEPASVGTSFVAGYEPSVAGSHSRDDTAAYLDFSQKLTDQWDVDIAGRTEHYSDVGTTTSGKFSTRYEFLPGYALRGTVNNGFRAPTLQEEYFQFESSGYSVNQITNVPQTSYTKTEAWNAPEARVLGATPLKPEKSMNYSVGFTAAPLTFLSTSIDIYRIDIKDRILLGSALDGTANKSVAEILSNAGLDPNQAISYFTNIGNTRTQGVDLSFDLRQDLDAWGKIRWSLIASRNVQEITKINAPPAVLAGIGVELVQRDRLGNLISAYPDNTVKLTPTWTIGHFDVLVRETYYSSTDAPNQYFASRDSYSPPSYITDVAFGYKPVDSLHFTVGANNVFNRQAAQIPNAAVPYYNFKADRPIPISNAPFDASGAFYYLRVSYAWK